MIAKQTLWLVLAAAGAAGAWLCAPGASHARAGSLDVLVDSDDDFLPDEVEWAVMTSPLNADTDGDEIGDFVEVVQRANPRLPGFSPPVDHEMRVVVTSPTASGPDPVWLHLFVRFVGTPQLMTSFETWFETPTVPGLHVPLSMMAFGSIVMRQRQANNEGLWLQVSVPMVSTQVLRAVLPCTIYAEATIGGRTIRTAAPLFDSQGVISTVVPFSATRVALQSISPSAVLPGAATNKVCLLDLVEAGNGPGGCVLEVRDADCEDCNDLECGTGCTSSIGSLIFVAGGIETITGG